MTDDDAERLFPDEATSPALAHFTTPSPPTPQEDAPMASGYSQGRDDRGRARLANAPCRSCRAPMRWVTFPSGKRNPLDAEPDPVYGNIALLELQDAAGRPWRIAVVLSNDDLLEEARALGVPLYRTHFATCPDADEHRREQLRARRDLA